MTAPLWETDDFVAATGGRPLGPRPIGIGGASIDSRTILPGEAFFAIRGERLDGHEFVRRALARGAATAVVSEDKLAGLGGTTGSLTVVADVLEALNALARAARVRSSARIAAVTGSVGKTGTKEMLAAALGDDGRVYASPASFNNHWGVPLSLARMPPTARFGVFEIGMNHPGEIEPLTKLVRPHVAIVTTVEAVHLAHFDDVQAIARAKAEIFAGVEDGGVAIVNRDNPHYELLAGLAQAAGVGRVIGFGENLQADARLETVKLKEQCTCVSARILDEPISYKVGAPGRHLVGNSLAVLAAVAVMGGDLAKGALALAALAPLRGRGDRYALTVGDGHVTLIDESYNANPASMRAAIALLGDTVPGPNGRRIAVLGDMRELGNGAAAMHGDLLAPLVAADVHRVYLCGRLMRALWRELPAAMRGGHCDTADELEPLVASAVHPGDVVMVKGSNASRMGPLVESLKTRFAPAGSAPKAHTEDAA